MIRMWMWCVAGIGASGIFIGIGNIYVTIPASIAMAGFSFAIGRLIREAKYGPIPEFHKGVVIPSGLIPPPSSMIPVWLQTKANVLVEKHFVKNSYYCPGCEVVVETKRVLSTSINYSWENPTQRLCATCMRPIVVPCKLIVHTVSGLEIHI